MISDDLKAIAKAETDERMYEALAEWYKSKIESITTDQQLKALLHQIDYNWDTVPELDKGGFRLFLWSVHTDENFNKIRTLMGWKSIFN